MDYKSQILSSIPTNNCCSLTFVNTIFQFCSEINLSNNTILVNANNDILNKTTKIILHFNPNTEFNVWNNFLTIKGNVYELLQNTNYSSKFNINFFESECDKLTLLKTLFITNSNFYYNQDNSKNSKGYNLELVFKNDDICQIVNDVLNEFGFVLRKIKRKGSAVLYTKNSNVICDLLVKLGATYTALEVQNTLAIREIRNTANRQNNCFEFNLDKTINASNVQLLAINYILDNFSIDYLDENLREIALVRIANPDATLNELKILLNNKISRAGIKYRLDKIIEIYNKIKGDS